MRAAWESGLVWWITLAFAIAGASLANVRNLSRDRHAEESHEALMREIDRQP